jgi:pimeloyl-ACP methyl ester carboxylesterase
MRRVWASLVLAIVLVLLSISIVSFPAAIPFLAVRPVAAQASPQLAMLNQAGERITTLTDGALVRFEITLSRAVNEETTYSLHLDRRSNEIGECRILAGETTCTTAPIGTLGWYWEADKVRPERTIHAADAALTRWSPTVSLGISINPRPVVLVHGFGSDYTTWLSYLGPSGLLALTGLKGFAVGDGQVPGVMHTGSLINPTSRTNTIAGNAAALGEYIANVKALTGAEQVDLVVHSMGGLISRYYIDRIMEERDIAQLIMLGTPNGGSNCAVMLGSLGLYEPAGLELREDYIRNVFNPQITEQHGIPFYNFAGTPIQQRLLSPCSKTPNDLVVSLDSAASAPVELVEVPILHIDLTGSAELFTEHVAPLLRKSAADFATQGAQPTPRVTPDEEPVQFSQIYTGVVTTPEGNTHIINIDNDVAVAAFGLYDPSRTLTVTVRGASGNVITLSPEENGLRVVDDPDALLYLGYGFDNPNPGPWQVTVHPTSRTPPLGSPYAIVAQYVGGATIDAHISNHLPGLGEQVVVTATLNLGNNALTLDNAQVILRRPDGVSEVLAFEEISEGIRATFVPEEVGIYGVDLILRAVLPDGTVAERGSYLALEAFVEAPQPRQ